MRLRRLVDLSDPTCVATALSLWFICLSPTPWGYTCVRPDFRVAWIYLWGAQAGAAVILYPRSRWAWISLGITALLTLPAYVWFDHASANDMPLYWLIRAIPHRFAGISPARLFLWATIIGGSVLAARGAFPSTQWHRPIGAVVIALVASLGVRVAPEFVDLTSDVYTFVPRLGDVLLILTYLSPAIVFPLVLWRAMRWSATFLLTLFTAATPLLAWMIVCDFDPPRRPLEILLAAAVAPSGGLTAWFTLRAARGPARGFDVLVKSAVLATG